MKISKTINPKFKPFSISIEVESDKDRALLFKLFGWDYAIPNWIKEQEGLTTEDHKALREFMTEIAHHLSDSPSDTKAQST